MNNNLIPVSDYKWIFYEGQWYVLEYPTKDDNHGWMGEYQLATGPFEDQEAGVDWFRKELDKLIEEQP